MLVRLLTGIIGLLTVSACVMVPVPVATDSIPIVHSAPPPPRYVQAGPPPTNMHFWVRGHWHNGKRGWNWKPGKYKKRPYRNAVWIPGHWKKKRRGWVWRPGHWRR